MNLAQFFRGSPIFRICLVLIIFGAGPALSQNKFSLPVLTHENLVSIAYQQGGKDLLWLGPGNEEAGSRQMLLQAIDGCTWLGLDPADYHGEFLQSFSKNDSRQADSSMTRAIDRIFTDAAIGFCLDLYRGKQIPSWVSSDEISPACYARDEQYILAGLLRGDKPDSLKSFLRSLEPGIGAYTDLRDALARALQKGDSAKVVRLSLSMNFLRWIFHFGLSSFVIVNIPSATLHFYSGDSLRLTMKAVVGKPSTRTPRMATYCNEIILYPYWNVPRKIVIKEYLPVLKKNPAAIEAMNMQVIDSHGNPVDYRKLNWPSFSKNNFPYGLRQATGCDNALGVLKFNLTDPYDVYMHDTNLRKAFASARRFYSHGCIRLEKPLLLANRLLDNQVDSSFLEACYRDQRPVPVALKTHLPVFVVYMPAESDSLHRISFFDDVYGLLKP